ncbi:MAG: 2-C-methyl-D-erythritol 4-phosphate cytidylyltransferase [Pirellulaceae bacterium]
MAASSAGSASRPAPTDEAEALERIGKPVAIVEGRPTNIKLTTATDLMLVKAILATGRRRDLIRCSIEGSLFFILILFLSRLAASLSGHGGGG